MKILVAEDDIDTQHMLVVLLQKWGYEVVTADNGISALEILKSTEGAPLLALLDWNMPGMDGVDVISKVRTQIVEKYIYVILLTARTKKSEMLAGLDVGADDYMKKPFDKQELKARLRAGERIAELKQELVQQAIALKEVNSDLLAANARMQRDLRTAANFQRSLLPQRVVQYPDFDVEWLYKPCDELAGDMLSVFRLDDRYMGFYLLDVSGHGVAASFLTGTLSRLLTPLEDGTSLVRQKGRGSMPYEIVSPAEVLAQLNEQFFFDHETRQYFTIVYVVLDTKSKRARFASAGHPDVMLTTSDAKITMVEGGGLPIGFMKEEVYEEHELLLEPGNRLFLFSDGLCEVMNGNGELYGMQRLSQAFEATQMLPLKNCIKSVIERTEQWGNGALEDDISILAVEAK